MAERDLKCCSKIQRAPRQLVVGRGRDLIETEREAQQSIRY